MIDSNTPRGLEAPSDELRARVADLVREVGTVRAHGVLGVSREAIARIAAGFALRPGTLSLVREKLASHDGQSRAVGPASRGKTRRS